MYIKYHPNLSGKTSTAGYRTTVPVLSVSSVTPLTQSSLNIELNLLGTNVHICLFLKCAVNMMLF